jgi:hypothetical protein
MNEVVVKSNTPKVAADASNKGYVDGKFTSAQSLLDAETSEELWRITYFKPNKQYKWF